jgi:Type VI secretion, TssG
MSFTMPDLRPSPGYMDPEKLRDAPPLDAVFQAPSADQAGRLQAQRRLVPTLRLEDAMRTLLHLGAALEAVRVVPVGIERSWRGEVVGQSPAPGAMVEPGTPIVLFVTLAGLQDRLPDGFLPSQESRDGRRGPAIDASEAADELMLEHRELDPGRRLLQILDGWMGRARTCLYQIQDAYDGAGSAEPLARYLLEVVGLGRLPADEESAVWLSGTLCHLPSAVAVPAPTGELLTAVLEERARVVEGPPARVEIPDELRNRLGSRNSRLGRDLVPGRAFLDARPSVTVVAGPEAAPEARAAVVESARRARAESWGEAMLPSREKPVMRHAVVPRDRLMRLGRTAANAVLGVTTYPGRAPDEAPRENSA